MSHAEDDYVDADDIDGDIVPDDDIDALIIPDDYEELADDDDDDDDDLDDDYDDYDDYEEATLEDIDFVVAMYREDSQPIATELAPQLANDLEELIEQLRRLPADAGAIGAVSIAGEFFVLCRVRGRVVQVLLSDNVAANDWLIARDVLDYLGVELPDEDDDSEPIGDFDILVDQGLAEFDLEQIANDLDEDSDQLVRQIAQAINYGVQFDRAIN